MFADSYAGKTVLVTGHTGFKGSWLSIWLARLGAKVVGYALEPPTTPSIFVSGRLADRMESITGDVRDAEHVARVVRQHRPDFVFHLAAAPLVRESYDKPAETFAVNLMGTLSVLDAFRREPYPCALVIVSTDKCYENREWEYGYRETDPLGGHDPYSASKGAMEIAVASYRRSFFSSPTDAGRGVRVATARAGNVVGGGDWAVDRIVPDATRALAAGEDLLVRNPRAVRPWQHVLEPLSGYLLLGARLAAVGRQDFASAWNFGPSPTQLYTVAELADALIKAWGHGAWRVYDSPRAPHEAGLLKLAIDKARLHLGWESVWDFNTTVEHTVEWYRKFYAPSDGQASAYDACLADIEHYEAAAGSKGLTWSS
jgi:CDP-glucose 4,6-dehydratase